MNILDLIKKRCTVRQYKDKKIPEVVIKKIIEAGIWGPSIHHFQPWRYIVIENAEIIKQIANSIAKKTKNIQLPGFLLLPTIKAVTGTKIMILVFNNNEFVGFHKKIFKEEIDSSYENIIRVAELSSIAAGIQNMVLIAESLGIGTCWLSSPLLCSKEICKLLDTTDELVAILTLGYPAEVGKRSPRKNFEKIVKFI